MCKNLCSILSIAWRSCTIASCLLFFAHCNNCRMVCLLVFGILQPVAMALKGSPKSIRVRHDSEQIINDLIRDQLGELDDNLVPTKLEDEDFSLLGKYCYNSVVTTIYTPNLEYVVTFVVCLFISHMCTWKNMCACERHNNQIVYS